jgi:hypothetical protein
MIFGFYLSSELEKAEELILSGRAGIAVERLNLILAQLSPNSNKYADDAVKVLVVLTKATQELGEVNLSNLYIKRIRELLSDSSAPATFERTSHFLALSEILISGGRLDEAYENSEHGLNCLADCLSDCDSDEVAETLRRYATIAKKTGALSSAYLALTVGLLLIQDLGGLDSLIAAETAELTSLACQAAYPSAISKIGTALLLRAA